jgi:hypothetical protein
MSREENEFRRSVRPGVRFLVPAGLGSGLMILAAALDAPKVQLAVLGCFISIVAGLLLSRRGQQERAPCRAETAEGLAVPLALASDPELFRFLQTIRDGLNGLANQSDGLLRTAVLEKLAAVNVQIESLSAGAVAFTGAEPWRMVYDALLANPQLKEYRAIAWVRSKDYWQDGPAQQSMRANFEAAHRGVLIERVIILPETLWPVGEHFPTEEIRPWIEEQHNHGLWVIVVRERDLAAEPDLLADFGLYDERAVGTQDCDERSRTVRFALDFGPAAIRLALDRWRRLSVRGISFRELLARSESAG